MKIWFTTLTILLALNIVGIINVSYWLLASMAAIPVVFVLLFLFILLMNK